MIAPMPTHPATQGSRQRACDLARAFQKKGDEVTFLYWTGEGLEPGALDAMEAAWDAVEIVSADGHAQRRSFPDYYGIDDWYDDAISARVAQLAAGGGYDACIVNYAWLSKALDALPRDVVRVIDMHDLLGDRAERFRAIGLAPDWFYTSVGEERRGLDRAELLIAIQDEEAVEARARSARQVFDIGYLARPFPVRRRWSAGGGLVAGYIGSANAFNLASVEALCAALQGGVPGMRFVAAGPVCDVLAGMDGQPFELLGRVGSLADFYGGIDVAINPMIGGTGLKIKTVEALAHGVAVVGTRIAFAGIASDAAAHKCADADAVVDVLRRLDAGGVERLRGASRGVFDAYVDAQERNFGELHARIVALRAAR